MQMAVKLKILKSADMKHPSLMFLTVKGGEWKFFNIDSWQRTDEEEVVIQKKNSLKSWNFQKLFFLSLRKQKKFLKNICNKLIKLPFFSISKLKVNHFWELVCTEILRRTF